MRILAIVGLLFSSRVAVAESTTPTPPVETKTEVKAEPIAPAPVEVRRAAILELKASGIDADVVRNLTDLLTAEAGKIPGFKVISQAEIKDMIGYEAQKQAIGCDDVSCLAQIGGALGADLIVTGTFAKMGDTFVVNVRLLNIASAETEARVGETIAGKLDLLPDFMRIVAWRLFTRDVPKDVLAGFEATKARLAEDAARAKGDSAALAAAEQARAEADRAKAEADKARAEAEILKAQQGGKSAEPGAPTKTAKAASGATSREPPPPAGGGWQRLGKNISTGVAILGLLAGATVHALSFMKNRSVGDEQEVLGGGDGIYEGTQTDAQAAEDLRGFAMNGYVVGGVGVVAAIVFAILEPKTAPATAWRVVPTPNGLAVEF